MPRCAKTMVLEWTAEHRDELMENWERCQNNILPKPVVPLE